MRLSTLSTCVALSELVVSYSSSVRTTFSCTMRLPFVPERISMTTGSLVSSQVARFFPFAIDVSSCFPWPWQPNTSPSASLLVDIKICSPKASHGRDRAEPIVSMCGSRWPCQRRFLLLTPLFDDTGYGSSAPVIPSQCRTSLKSGRTQARLPAVIASPASTVDQIAMSTVATVKGSAHQTFFPFFLVPRRNPEARAGGWKAEGSKWTKQS